MCACNINPLANGGYAHTQAPAALARAPTVRSRSSLLRAPLHASCSQLPLPCFRKTWKKSNEPKTQQRTRAAAKVLALGPPNSSYATHSCGDTNEQNSAPAIPLANEIRCHHATWCGSSSEDPLRWIWVTKLWALAGGLHKTALLMELIIIILY